MKPSIFEIILFSLLLHLGLLLFISRAPENNTTTVNTKIDVSYIKKSQNGQKPLISHSSRKYAKPRPGPNNTKKDEQIDLTDYANRLKLLVDPVWVRNIQGVHKNILLNLLAFCVKEW